MPTIRLVPQQRRRVRLVPMGGGSDGKLISPVPEEQILRPKKEGLREKITSFFDPKATAPQRRVLFNPFIEARTTKPVDVKEVAKLKRETPWLYGDIPEKIKRLEPDIRQTTTKWQETIAHHFDPQMLNEVMYVMHKESSGNPDTVHPNKDGSKDYGLMQINDIHAPAIKREFGYNMQDMLDPEKNLEVARWLYNQSGWQPWVGARGMNL